MTTTATDRELYQRGLIQRYQQSLTQADGDRRGVDRDGRAALDDLVEDIRLLLWDIINKSITKRFGGRPKPELAEECFTEMITVAIDAAGRYDPARCPSFASWITGEQGEARAVLYRCLDTAAGLDGFAWRDRRALRMAHQAENELRARLGRDPSNAEIQETMEDYCYRYQFERLTPQQQALPEDEWRKIARGKLVNLGLLRAIREIDQIRAAALPAYTPDGFDSGWDILEDTADAAVGEFSDPADAVELVRMGLSGLSEIDKKMVYQRLGAGPEDADSSATGVAEHYQVSIDHVRKTVDAVTARIGSAHAQYAFLSEGLSTQFEQAEPEPETGGAVAALLSRLRSAPVS